MFDTEHAVGTSLGLYNDGYFSSPEHAQAFPKTINRAMSQKAFTLPESKPFAILGLGAGPGLPEIITARALKAAGYNPCVILTDMVSEAMADHYPGYGTDELDEDRIPWRKVLADNRKLVENEDIKAALTEFGSRVKISLATMRSALHYEDTEEAQLEVIEQVFAVLAKGGAFVLQEQAFPSQEEADLVRDVRKLVGKNTLYLTDDGFTALMDHVFGSDNVGASSCTPPPFIQTSADFRKRYDVSDAVYAKIMSLVKRRYEASEELQRADHLTLTNGKNPGWQRSTASKIMYGVKVGNSHQCGGDCAETCVAVKKKSTKKRLPVRAGA
ncbi:MAG TPA: hypothetical protein VIT68_04410 [Candidatus Gracilibacteria bacterium]